MGLNPFAPSSLVPELAEALVIRGQTETPLSSVTPYMVVCGTCPLCSLCPTTAHYFDGPALAGLSPFSQMGASACVAGVGYGHAHSLLLGVIGGVVTSQS